MSLWMFVDTLTVHWNVWIDIVIQCHYNQWHWCWVPVGAKKSPFPPKFNVEVSAAVARKTIGGFFFAPACMTPHSNIELGGSRGRAFFLHRPVSSQVVFMQIHISSIVLRCSSQRDLARWTSLLGVDFFQPSAIAPCWKAYTDRVLYSIAFWEGWPNGRPISSRRCR